MQGLWISGKRPASKRAVKLAVEQDPETVRVLLQPNYYGPLTWLLAGRTVYFAGPDPYRARRFYGSITRTAAGALVVK